MSRLSWAKAKQTLAGLFAEWPDQWPQRLAPVHLARLQAPLNGKDRSLTRAFDEAMSAACAAGELAHETADFVFPPLVAWASLEDRPGEGAARWRAQCTTESLPAVTAGDFVAWLHKQGETPSGHVAAWVEATGGAAVPVPGKVRGTLQAWTPERLADLAAYREQHGTKKAAQQFGVSESRVRALLPTGKPATKGYSAFTHRLK